MGNMCCRREVFAPNAADTDPSRFGHHHQTQHQLGPEHHPQKPHQSQQQRPVMSSAYHPAGDDCAINELLEGRMDLDVLMPDGRQVRLTVERRTPMMDLLVQAASATKISPGGHVIQVFGDGDKSNGTLPYKPSTPIGSLDTNTIYVVSKKDAVVDPQFRRNGKTAHRPFEPTFRVQVHLPRNQLTVLRVSPKVKIAELKTMVCKEKGLDTSRYQLVRPSGPTQPLSGDITLSEYGSTEITLLSNSSIESNICNSTSHIMPYPKRTEEHKRKTGILRLLAEDANHKNANFNSTHQIDGNQRKVKSKTADINVHQHRFKPKKRRPAPPPPPPVLPEAPSHSRQSSSDSSGYHEATSSFLHEEHSGEEKASSDSSGVSSMDAKGPSIQQQTTPPIPNSKKKKAPAPPPPPSKKEKEIRKETIVLQDQTFKEEVAAQDSVIYKDIIPDKQLHIQVLNPVTETDSSSKINFTEKDLTVQQNFTDKNSIPHNDSSALTSQIVQTALTSEAIKVTKKSPVLDDIIVENNSAPDKNLPTHETMVVLNNDHNLKDHATKQDPLSQKDQNPSADSVILPDQMALVDPVLKQEAKSEKILNLQIQDNENKMLQIQTAGASEDIIVPNDETDLNEEKEVKCNTLIEVKQRTSAPIPLSLNTQKYSSSEKKVEKNKLASKSEAVSTRVALVALNARIEQDVTQKEIASSIQAAFHSLDCSPHQPSLLAIKQRNRENPRSNSSQYSNGSSESHETLPLKKASVTLNSKSCSKVVKESLSETSTRFSAFEKEALFIDDESPPRPASATPVSTTNLKRASSLLNFTDAVVPRNVSCKNTKRVRHLQRSLSDLSVEDKEDFEAEQERLQQEYIKLQRQFIIWQQQLMNNHAMLREECLVPQYARTLRQSHSLPEGEDYSNETTPSAPLVSRSLSYEPTKERCSTLPRSTINIPSLEFGTLQINNGTTTLRSSKTKSYFKPPQVRVSTKSRQRIPPEIKKEGDVDITDDTKMLTTILPSFESLKLISENSEEDIHLSVSRLKDTMSSTKSYPLISQGRKVPQVHLSSTFSKLNSKLNNGDRIADTDLKCVNGDTGQSKLSVNRSKITEPSSNAQLPPPPPPTPIEGVTKVTAKENCTKATGHTAKENCTKATGQKNGVGRKEVTPCVDSRDQLMQEIRKFGGRTALRKISLAS